MMFHSGDCVVVISPRSQVQGIDGIVVGPSSRDGQDGYIVEIVGQKSWFAASDLKACNK